MDEPASISLLAVALLGAGTLAGFAGGLFGIGGGFVVVPALLLILPLLGTGPADLAHAAVGTSLATVLFTSLRSVRAHARRGSVDSGVIRSWAPWVVLGTICGAMVADRVSSGTLGIIFAVGALLFAAHFLAPALHDRQLVAAMPRGIARIGLAGGLGLLSSLLGIGGGAIATVIMTLSGVPIHRAIGTAAGMGALIAVPGAIGFMIIGLGRPGLPWGSIGYVNVPAALAIMVTAVLFAPLGVAVAHKLSPRLLRNAFGLYLLAVGAAILVDF